MSQSKQELLLTLPDDNKPIIKKSIMCFLGENDTLK